MSGAEAIIAIGLIGSCISIADGISKIASAAGDAQGLPPKLRDLIETVPQIQEILKSAQKSFDAGKVDETTSKNAKPSIEQCKKALEELQEIFNKACPLNTDGRGKRLWKGTKIVFFGRNSRVKELLKVVKSSMELLEQKKIFVIGDQLDDLNEVIQALENDDSSTYTHSGTGNIVANEGGWPTNYVQGGSKNRQINSPGTYHESNYQVQTYKNYMNGPSTRGVGINSNEESLLEAAAYGPNKRIERILKTDVVVDFRDSDGRTALHLAAQFGHEDIVKQLISADCDIDVVSRQYGTALCLAALKRHRAIVDIILGHGADVTADSAGSLGSPLHAACAGGDAEIAGRLINRSVLPVGLTRTIHEDFVDALLRQTSAGDILETENRRMYGSFSPLHLAAERGHLDVVHLLLMADADVNALGNWWSNDKPCTFRNATECFKDLTPLILACITTALSDDRSAEVVRRLLAGNAKVRHFANDISALHAAATAGKVACIDLLLRDWPQGIDLPSPRSRRTPIMEAAVTGKLTAVRRLIWYGADLDATDHEGYTAEMLADHHGKVECLLALRH